MLRGLENERFTFGHILYAFLNIICILLHPSQQTQNLPIKEIGLEVIIIKFNGFNAIFFGLKKLLGQKTKK
jgi:hypothetical protein